MIRKTTKDGKPGYKVVSESGKTLSRVYTGKGARARAAARLRQIEYFKHRGGKK